MQAEVEFSGWDAEEAAHCYFVSTVEWGTTVTRWADDLRAVGRCVAEADGGSTVIIRIPDKPTDLPVDEPKEPLAP